MEYASSNQVIFTDGLMRELFHLLSDTIHGQGMSSEAIDFS